MSGGSGDFPVQLATRLGLPDWSAGGLLWCSAARLSVCRVVLHSPDTHDYCCEHLGKDVTREKLPWNFRLTERVFVTVCVGEDLVSKSSQ